MLEAAEVLGVHMEDVLIGAEHAQELQPDYEECSNPETNIEQKVHINANDSEVEVDKKSWEVLNIKMPAFVKGEDGRFKCSKCSTTSVRIGNVRQHWKEVHHTGVKVFKCQECEFQTNRKGHFKSHDKAKHQGVRYDCRFCDFQSAYSKGLRRHIELRHNNGETPFQCVQCGFLAGFNKKDLRNHVRDNHRVEPEEENK